MFCTPSLTIFLTRCNHLDSNLANVEAAVRACEKCVSDEKAALHCDYFCNTHSVPALHIQSFVGSKLT